MASARRVPHVIRYSEGGPRQALDQAVFSAKRYRSALLDSPRRLSDHPAKPCEATAMDVGGWLRGLGLGQYEEKFRDNKIDADLLPRLTVDDLKDIGVSVVGDRRRL